MVKHLDAHGLFGLESHIYLDRQQNTSIPREKWSVRFSLVSSSHPLLGNPQVAYETWSRFFPWLTGLLNPSKGSQLTSSPGAHTLPFWLLDAEAQIQAGFDTSKIPGQQLPPPPGSVERGPRDVASANTYFESWVSNEASVVTEIGRVMLHHALGLRLAEVLIGGGKAAGRQHDGWTFWKRPRQSQSQNTEASSGAHTKASPGLCQHVCYGGLMSSTRTQRARQWEKRKKGGKTPPTFSPFRELMVLWVEQEGAVPGEAQMLKHKSEDS